MGRRGRCCGATVKLRGRGESELTDEDMAAALLAAVREQPGATARQLEDAVAVRSERVRDFAGRLSRPASSSTSATGGATLSISPTIRRYRRSVRPDRDERGTNESSAAGGVARPRSSVRPNVRGTNGWGRTTPPPSRRRTNPSDGTAPHRPRRRRAPRREPGDGVPLDRRGELPAIRLPSGAIRYRADELDDWLEARATQRGREEPASLRHLNRTGPTGQPNDRLRLVLYSENC